MPLHITPSTDLDTLLPLLRDADEDMARISQAVETHSGYLAYVNDVLIGAAVIEWEAETSEILYIAVDSAVRGKGYGKAFIAWIMEEARRRSVKALIVGTANSSLENIAFYQKCGFRIDSVRKDYFDYFSAPVYDNGIQLRDMLVFRCEL
jgi:ribosomal protein S18 acetylase RimI-like enzyme